MLFPKTFIEKCTASKDVREMLNHAHLDTDAARLYASDGHKAIFMPVVVSHRDTSGPVTREAIAAARKLAGRGDTCEINCAESLSLANGQTFPRPQNLVYPDIERIMPEIDTDISITIDAQYLLEIAKAINTGSHKTRVTLHIPKDTESAMRVSTLDAPDTRAVIMPVRM